MLALTRASENWARANTKLKITDGRAGCSRLAGAVLARAAEVPGLRIAPGDTTWKDAVELDRCATLRDASRRPAFQRRNVSLAALEAQSLEAKWAAFAARKLAEFGGLGMGV